MNSQSNSLITTPQITLPTTFTAKTAALKDKIFVNGQAQKYNSGKIRTFRSDHIAQHIMTENDKGDKPATKTAKTKCRDHRNFDMDSFKIDLEGIDWTFATHNNNVNLDFKAFLRLFNTILDKHEPIKELTKKDEKDKLKP